MIYAIYLQCLGDHQHVCIYVSGMCTTGRRHFLCVAQVVDGLLERAATDQFIQRFGLRRHNVRDDGGCFMSILAFSRLPFFAPWPTQLEFSEAGALLRPRVAEHLRAWIRRDPRAADERAQMLTLGGIVPTEGRRLPASVVWDRYIEAMLRPTECATDLFMNMGASFQGVHVVFVSGSTVRHLPDSPEERDRLLYRRRELGYAAVPTVIMAVYRVGEAVWHHEIVAPGRVATVGDALAMDIPEVFSLEAEFARRYSLDDDDEEVIPTVVRCLT